VIRRILVGVRFAVTYAQPARLPHGDVRQCRDFMGALTPDWRSCVVTELRAGAVKAPWKTNRHGHLLRVTDTKVCVAATLRVRH
jgi:hypothetical protein